MDICEIQPIKVIHDKKYTVDKQNTDNSIKESTNNIKENDNKIKKNKRNKCSFCNKKLKLITYDCKCGLKFCSECRYPEIHKCININAKITEERKKLENDNPLIDFEKVKKI